MLHHIPNSNLALIKDRMFDNLSNYYPIDFEGDTEKHNINLHRIINLLN